MAKKSSTLRTKRANRYPCPTYTITSNSEVEDNFGKHDTSPSWVVVFVRYETPVAMFNSGRADLLKIKDGDPMIIENDCISVSCNNSKSSFIKNCNMTFKAGEVFYINAARPGDWVLVWMVNHQYEADQITETLRGRANRPLSDFNSGLKFMGRVGGVSSADTITTNGVRTVTQSIVAYSFLELASTVYLTSNALKIANPTLNIPNSVKNPNQTVNESEITKQGFIKMYGKYQGLINEFQNGFNARAQKGLFGYAPDRLIGLLLIFTMGIDKSASKPLEGLEYIRASFNDAIVVPRIVAQLMGKPKANRLWEFYNVYLGVQDYRTSGEPWDSFLPSAVRDNKPAQNENKVFYSSPETDGAIPWSAPVWENQSVWSILQAQLNPVVNEMYTCLRIGPAPKGKGRMALTIVVREQPFSSGLYNYIYNVDKAAQKRKLDKQKAASQPSKAPPSPFDPLRRPSTYFCNLPRWIIDDSVITSVITQTRESDRVNFVQVWGDSANAMSAGLNIGEGSVIDALRRTQMNAPNWYVDERDVARSGLRGDVGQSQFDYINDGENGTRTTVWARKRADWLFNGHLKLSGTISCKGILEPICEGDNVEVRGIVYHIEDVTHQGQVQANGRKTFNTVLQVSRGVLAKSLTSNDAVPEYAFELGGLSKDIEDMPGITDIQYTLQRNRRQDGETQ